MAQSSGKKIATWIILGLLFVGLIGFGSTSLSGNLRTVGRVGETEITVQEYARELQGQIRALEAQAGRSIPLNELQTFGLDSAVLGQLIGTHVLENETLTLGLSAGDERVAGEITAVPQFRGASGEFDRETYRFALDRAGLSEAEFEESLRGDLARSLLQSAVADGIPAPDAYAESLAAWLGETRSFLWAPLTEADLAEPLPEPTASELQTYYEANTDSFLSPETRAITYAVLTPAMIVDEVTVDEDALRQLYEAQIADYVRPERRLVERLVFETEEAAGAASGRLSAGEIDFDGLVRERGLDLASIDLGDVTEDELRDAGAAVFSIAPGEVTAPAASPLGPALFRVNAILPAQETPFEEARAELRTELAAERARRVIEQSAEGLTDLMAGGATVEDLADRSDMELGTIELTGDSSEGIAAYAAFREAAAATAPGDFPDLIELEDGGLAVIRVDEVVAPAPIPLDAARPQVSEAWRQAELRARLLARAEEMAAEIEAAGDWPDGLPVPNAETGLDRRAFVPDTPPGFLTEVFAMDTGAARALPMPGGALVVQLTAVTAADLTDEDLSAAMARLSEEAQAGITRDIFEVYTRSLQSRTEVQIDEAAVNAVNTSFQ
jgi:peptidyl-prolyl cis-trans isomerase D